MKCKLKRFTLVCLALLILLSLAGAGGVNVLAAPYYTAADVMTGPPVLLSDTSAVKAENSSGIINEEWEFEGYVPLVSLPTGDTTVRTTAIIVIALTLCGAVITMITGHNKRNKK